ncbi:MAG: type II/IV secretion system ATPase subunit [Candidatus Thalassarchaeaceae archaeon]|jgi:flagellar protein FlaI|nr:type II/IV secretion system ATPase subunit [Candidatus Thalassarchaeaceae archaeon]MDP7257092.1 type II/IV secretion system ATPase subunit [Candidatus Thalassarchaeaceae archaeon]MDP7445711.1 type II/IV secretion system ATPase subunit [Candidatus Thalassarchaeaceae archaeon]MDP7649736.1 type II/IV secretion system ATPase subunit [Candidatus Thalassarchaeaceae archaeon]HJL55024.1 type II/IV secretion system ATPase subunit [Candidatus Thalassarchaeaceae archaeon]|tara:strand:+ start:1863 stop:3608 length:1746 start_codon:yes stop_codon:yes gene_type:complete
MVTEQEPEEETTTKHELTVQPGDLGGLMAEYPHIRQWVEDFEAKHGSRPIYYGPLDRDARAVSPRNLIYATRPPCFAHVYSPPEGQVGAGNTFWYGLEPAITHDEEEIRDNIVERLLRDAPQKERFDNDAEFIAMIHEMMDEMTTTTTSLLSNPVINQTRELLGFGEAPIKVTTEQLERLKYVVVRDLVNNGPLETLLADEMLEDIHSIGLSRINMDHKVFPMLTSNIAFKDQEVLTKYLRSMSERIGRPVSDSKPIVDGALLDGSRINIIYSDDVSIQGSSFTIRKFAEETISIIQLIQWKTLSSQMAAYIWLGLESGMSMLVSGETASGKTTTLNAVLPFVDHNVKIYTAEDTPEVKVSHTIWQRLITRDSKNEDSRVEMFDLLKAALRSRPRYIIIGEIRGVEGAIAFQAMQTGHPVVGTFHASNIVKLIQRFTGDPINVPARFFDNLNFAIFQEVVEAPGGGIARRITGVSEVIGFDKTADGILTRNMFEWDPVNDEVYFRGMFQSDMLENKIAPRMGFRSKRDIYDELARRTDALQRMVDRDLTHFDDVFDLLDVYYKEGWDRFTSAVDTWTGINH